MKKYLIKDSKALAKMKQLSDNPLIQSAMVGKAIMLSDSVASKFFKAGLLIEVSEKKYKRKKSD